MGEFKPLLKFGDETALKRLIRSAKLSKLDDIIVVTGHQNQLLEPIIHEQKVRSVHNNLYEEGMFTSIKAGLAEIGEEIDAFFILPVDYPLVPAQVFLEMIEKYEENPNSIIVPCYMGKKGHPPLLPRNLIPEILDHAGKNGLKDITIKHESRILKLELEFEEVVMDMDTISDYEELLRHLEKTQTPDEKYCLYMLQKFKTPAEAKAHCICVGSLAVKIGEELNKSGANLNIALIRSAALLHDIVRNRPRHGEAGALICRLYGFDKVAKLVEKHMSYDKEDDLETISEQDVLCLSDKMMRGDKLVTLKDRATPVLHKFKDNSEALEKVNERYKKARELEIHINQVTGKTIQEIWEQKTKILKPDNDRKLYLIRHGETKRHKEKIFLGQTDLDLSTQGIEQAEEAALKLLLYNPKVSKVYCSDLKRAMQTAEIISKKIFTNQEQKLEALPDFREISLGSWDGKFISKIKEKFPSEYENRGQNLLSFKIDQNAENYFDLRYRVMKKLNQLLEQDKDKDIILITHNGVVAVIRSSMENIPLEEAVLIKHEYCGIHIIEI